MKQKLIFSLLIAVFMLTCVIVTLVFSNSEQTSYKQVVFSAVITSETEPEKTTTAEVVTGKTNINTANSDELESLPGIGEVTAQKIISYRNENGKFDKIEEIMEVSGIGEKKFQVLKDLICV